MKKMRLVLIAVCIGASFIALTVIQSHAQAIQLTYANFFPPGHVQSQLVDSWIKEVETRTNGRVKIKHYPGATLLKPDELYEGVVKGRADLGMTVLGYTPDRFPLMSTVDLPLGYTTGKMATAVANVVYRRFKPKELTDTKVLYLHAHGPGLINTRGRVVRRLEDMRGLRLRAHGFSAGMVEALGGIAVAKPMTETYQMIKKGMVAGAVHPQEALKGWKLGEVEDYITASYAIAYTTTFCNFMNLNKWNTLPKDIQTIIEEIDNEWVVQHGEAWDTSDREGFQYFLSLGKQIIGLDAAESARWKKAVAPVIEAHVKYLNGKGLNGREIVDFTINTAENMR